MRLKVNLQLEHKKYKAEIKKLNEELEDAKSQIFQQQYMKWRNCSYSPVKGKVIKRNLSDRQLFYVSFVYFIMPTTFYIYNRNLNAAIININIW